jgi:hypothetical protein
VGEGAGVLFLSRNLAHELGTALYQLENFEIDGVDALADFRQ